MFNLQLESCISLYYVTRGIQVKTIHATTRFSFLGINGWNQHNRYTRKQKVVNEITKLLDTTLPGNMFASRDHDLTGWHKYHRHERHDVADALAQCLTYYYRNKSQVMACNPAPIMQQSTADTSTPPSYQQAGTTQRKRQQQKPSKAELRGKIEMALAQLRIDYYQLLKP